MIFLDHEALPVLEYSKEEMSPTPEVLEDIKEIASDPLNRNIVIVFSNQSVQMLSEHFAPITKNGLDNLWLAAESGYLYKANAGNSNHSSALHHNEAPHAPHTHAPASAHHPNTSPTDSDNSWHKLISLSNKVWFNSVYEVMRTYTENVDGAVVEERESTLVWNYKNAEEEHGSMVVGELYAQIK